MQLLPIAPLENRIRRSIVTESSGSGFTCRIQADRAKIVQAALGDDVGLIGTVPLVASALPELAT